MTLMRFDHLAIRRPGRWSKRMTVMRFARLAHSGASRWSKRMAATGAIARAAAQQHGMVTLAQLAAAGLGRGAVAHRVARGRLTPRFRGVYQVGPIQAEHGREAAAVLAAGPGALLSHHTAAAIWGFTPDHPGDVHVTVPSDARSRPGLTLHRSASLNAAVHNGLPLTTPARTLHDLARVLPGKTSTAPSRRRSSAG
jgi:predicted transcriptional regulator of viral defense system